MNEQVRNLFLAALELDQCRNDMIFYGFPVFRAISIKKSKNTEQAGQTEKKGVMSSKKYME
jgi:hypothetical protein